MSLTDPSQENGEQVVAAAEFAERLSAALANGAGPGATSMTRTVYWAFGVAMGDASEVLPDMEFSEGSRVLGFDLPDGTQHLFVMAPERWREVAEGMGPNIEIVTADRLPPAPPAQG